MVVDLGYGTLGRLLAHVGSGTGAGIDAVVVTHHHPDHAIDLHGLFRARWFGSRGADALPLYAPRGVVDLLRGLEDDDAGAVGQVFAWHPLPAAGYDVGPFRLDSVALPHFVPNAGVRLSSPELSVAFTGDTGPSGALAELGRGVDLYVVEATDRHQQAGTPPAPEGGELHLSGRQAGIAAKEAGARRLLITHFWPGNDRSRSRAEAQRAFDGDVLVADEGMMIGLP